VPAAAGLLRSSSTPEVPCGSLRCRRPRATAVSCARARRSLNPRPVPPASCPGGLASVAIAAGFAAGLCGFAPRIAPPRSVLSLFCSGCEATDWSRPSRAAWPGFAVFQQPVAPQRFDGGVRRHSGRVSLMLPARPALSWPPRRFRHCRLQHRLAIQLQFGVASRLWPPTRCLCRPQLLAPLTAARLFNRPLQFCIRRFSASPALLAASGLITPGLSSGGRRVAPFPRPFPPGAA